MPRMCTLGAGRLSALVLGAFFSIHAFAGTTLFLKSGEIDLKNDKSWGTLRSERAFSQRNFVVQFHQRISEQDKALLREKNWEIIDYIPEDALLIRHLSQKPDMNSLNSLPQVRGVMPLISSWKMSPAISPSSVFNADQPILLSVKTFDDGELSGNFSVLASSGQYHVVSVLRKDLDLLVAHEDILWVEPAPNVELFVADIGLTDRQLPHEGGDYTDLTGFETGTKIMGFESAWERGYTGLNQIVSAADTGLDQGETSNLHQDFANVPEGHVFGLFAKDWSDPMGHGTHVAGSVMSSGLASGQKFVGGAYNSEMIPQGMWSPVMKNLTVPPQLSKLFAKAYESGARIHTNSWGSPRNLGVYDGMARQVDEYMWQNPDFLILFAAGNSGRDDNRDGRVDDGSISSPGTAKNALTVGASENYLLEGGIQRTLGELLDGKAWSVEPMRSDKLSNDANGIAAFSSRGPTQDGRLKPDIVAPGTNIVSNCSQVEGSSPLWGNYNSDYCYAGGTSMSTPLTAGAAAVTREYLQKEWSIAAPSADLIKAVLMASAEDLYPGQYGEVGKSRGQELLSPGPNNHQGYGRVNMQKATVNKSSRSIQLFQGSVGTGEESRFELTGIQSQSFKATLVYTDAPGSETASKALVNNLSLEIGVFKGQDYIADAIDSLVNNSEQLQIDNVSGEVTVVVHGANVPMGKNGKQPYALVVTY